MKRLEKKKTEDQEEAGQVKKENAAFEKEGGRRKINFNEPYRVPLR